MKNLKIHIIFLWPRDVALLWIGKSEMIIKTIKNIAFRTDIPALNAAVEAV